jgi:hypothetical protein
VEIDGNVEAC